ncbi:hypothetical protein [Empedobacter tilapiae]
MKYCVMSIKPNFYEKIKKGKKIVEYRKVAPKGYDKIIFYVSAPVKKILGYIEIDKIITDSPENIWESTKNIGGIDEKYFFDYSKNKNKISAIYIKSLTEFKTAIELKEFTPPQNYLFRTDEELSNLD